MYRIYLNLNMGPKFEEIDGLLDKHMREVRHSENQVMMHNINSSQEVKNMDKHLAKP